jgi:hypothetical protein
MRHIGLAELALILMIGFAAIVGFIWLVIRALWRVGSKK